MLWKHAVAELVEIAFSQCLERLRLDRFILQFPYIAGSTEGQEGRAVTVFKVLPPHAHRAVIARLRRDAGKAVAVAHI